MKKNLLKLFLLITTLTSSFTISAQSSHQRTANIVNETSAPYYAVYSNSSEKIDISNENGTNLDVNLAYPCNNVNFKITTTRFILWGTTNIAIDATKTGNWDDTKQIHSKSYKGDSQSGSQSLDTAYSKIAFKCTGGSNSDEFVHDVKFTIAPHLILTTKTIDFGNVEFNGGSSNKSIEFHSFYNANAELKITGNTNPNVFRITTTKIADKGKLKKVNTTDYAVQVSFYPNAVGNHSATITISDGQFTETVTLNGVGTKKSQQITWNETNQICIGATLENPATVSTGNTITYSSSNPEIIAVEGNTLRPLAEGKATITASVAENDTHFSATSTKEFEATNKTLQSISWSQDFSNLRQGGNDIQLTATASSGLDIVYTSDNENIVKINGNTLTIVGEGQTYIHATQAGNDTYASISESRFVYVYSTAACANYALSAPDKISKSGAIDWNAITATYNLTAPGDKLSFTATCSAASTGKALRVYDDLGNSYVNESDVESKSNIQLDKRAKTITIVLDANLDRSISDVYVTQATYLEGTQNIITLEATEIGSNASTSTGISYSNINGLVTIALKNGTNFSINKQSFETSCGQYGTETININLKAETTGILHDTLVVSCGDHYFETPIVAEVIKHYQSISWEQELTDLIQGNSYDLEATASSSLPVYYTSSNENVARIENNKLIIVGAGEVTITANQDGDINFETATPVSKTIAIAKLDQTITWNQEFASDLTIGNTVELSATATSGEAVVFSSSNEAVATISDNILTIVGIGEATITASQAGNNNYNAATEVAKILNTAKLDQTITWNQDIADLQIGESATLNATASSNLEVTYSSSDETIATIDGTTITIVKEGTVTITATQAGDNTYNPASIEKTFTFGRTAQTITWNDDLSALAINDTVTLTATSDAGLYIIYTIDNTAVATIEGNTLIIIGAGEATITASQAGNETYNSASTTKTINIAKFTQTITWEQDLSEISLADNLVELTAEASSGLTITYTTSNEAVAQINGNILSIVGEGEATITAIQEGNENYAASTTIEKTIVITKKSQEIVWEQDFADLDLFDYPYELTAYATSGLTITYELAEESQESAIIEDNYLYPIAAGYITIYAYQEGNELYKAAKHIEKTVYISEEEITVKVDDTATTMFIYANDMIHFNGEHSSLRVYDMTGRMVYNANVEGSNSHYLPLSQRGIYVICLDNQTLKIVK